MPEYSTQELSDDLATALAPDQIDAAAWRSLAAFDVFNRAMIAEAAEPLACRVGCSLCCWLRVDVFAHEVLPIARYVRANFAAEEITLLAARLAEHASIVSPLTPFEHATRNTACPLLVDGRCSVYAVRPQSCRRHHSLDFAACQYTFDHPTDLEAPAAHDRALFRTLTEAMGANLAVYAAHNFDQTIYELGTALREALEDDASESRWLQREPAFRTASITPLE